MPSVDIHVLREKKKLGIDLTSQEKKLQLKPLSKALRWAGEQIQRKGDSKVATIGKKLVEFADAIFDVSIDPTPEGHRERIENSIAQLDEFGDFLGAKDPENPYDNVYNRVAEALEDDDGPVSIDQFETALKALNDVLELDMPVDQILAGEIVTSSSEKKHEREAHHKNVQQRREHEQQIIKEDQDAKKQQAFLRKQLFEKQQKLLEEKEEEERKKQREKEEKERKEREEAERRALEEAKKSAEQKERERKAAEQKKIQTELSHQEAMRQTIDQRMRAYRDPSSETNQKIFFMATVAAFQRELDRVGPTGRTPINPNNVNEDIERFYKSGVFGLAKKTGALDTLVNSTPSMLLQKLTETDEQIDRDHVNGAEGSHLRARRIFQQMDATWRVKKDSEAFTNAKNAIREIAELNRPATRDEQYVACEIVKKYVSKNLSAAKSETGAKRMGLAMAFLKQTMTPAAFKAYCSSLNAQRQIPTQITENGAAFNLSHERAFDPNMIGTLDEIYNETRERIGALSRKEDGEPIDKPDHRDLALMTAVCNLKKAAGPNGGNLVVDKGQLETEILKVQSDRRFREAYQKDSAETLIDKAWWGNVNTLAGYSQPVQKIDLSAQM